MISKKGFYYPGRAKGFNPKKFIRKLQRTYPDFMDIDMFLYECQHANLTRKQTLLVACMLDWFDDEIVMIIEELDYEH